MHKTYLKTFLFIFLVILMSPVRGEAQLFGSDEENWSRIFLELKKINHRLVTIETEGIYANKNQPEYVLREIEEVKNAMSQFQGAIEVNLNTINSTLNTINKRLEIIEERLTAF